MRNYPDGMSEGDLPGYWEIDCPDCAAKELFDEHCERCDGTGVVDQRDIDAERFEQAAILAAEDARYG